MKTQFPYHLLTITNRVNKNLILLLGIALLPFIGCAQNTLAYSANAPTESAPVENVAEVINADKLNREERKYLLTVLKAKH